MRLPIGACSLGVFVDQHFAAPLQVLGEVPRFFIQRHRALLVGHGQLITEDAQAPGVANKTGKADAQLPVIRRQALQQRLEAGIAKAARPLLPGLPGLLHVLRQGCLSVHAQGYARQWVPLDLAQAVVTRYPGESCRQNGMAWQQAVERPLQALGL
ncbi:hypothetical protein D3C85_1372310 [compost metagenome]